MKQIKTALILLVIMLSLAPLAAEGIKEELTETAITVLPVENVTVTGFDKHGNTIIDLAADKMLSDGYEYGDTVNIAFSNGMKYHGIPFYNGNYAHEGEVYLKTAPTIREVRICVSYGSMKDDADLEVGDTAKITLSKKKGAIETQLLNALSYTMNRSDYSSDEVYANFRPVTVGNIGEGKFYRSCSPISNIYNRAQYADRLIASAGVKTVFNLSDSEGEIDEAIRKGDFNSPYYKSLYDAGNVRALNLGANVYTDTFRDAIASAMSWFVREGHETPLLVHCKEGKDRAGFTSVIIEALMGATYEEIASDYMKTYENYYGITKEDAERYNVILNTHLNRMVKMISGVENVSEITQPLLESGVRNYLIAGGMTETEIESFVNALK